MLLPDSTTIAYDADGRRVQQTVGAAVTNYLWDELSLYGDVVLETDGGGAVLARYVLGNGRLISQTRGGTPSYYLTDAQGSVRALTDASGTITDTYDYTAYGELYAQTGTTTNAYLYTGQQFDALTGLYSLRARYYDPAVGRFLSRDTYDCSTCNPNEHHRYAYTANNPVTMFDPTGHTIAIPWGTGTGLITGGITVSTPVVVTAIGVLLATTIVCLYLLDPAVFSKSQGTDYPDDLTVRDILKKKKGTIKDAPMEKGFPGWDDEMDMTWREVKTKAKQGVAGFKTLKKLLGQKRFDKGRK